MEPRIQYARTKDGVSIAFASMGEGLPLVRVPPPGVTHVQRDPAMYEGIFQALPRTFRFIWYDARGTGLSDRDAIDFSIEAMARDLDAVIERTGLDSFALLAFLGSVPMAVTYAVMFADRVSHLILIDGWTNSSDFKSTPAQRAAEALRDQDWTLSTDTFARVLWGIDDPDLAERWGEHIRASIEPEAYRAFVAAQDSYDVSAFLPEVKATTLVLHNSNHRFVPIRAGQKLAAAIPDARFLSIDDVTYQQVASFVEEFLGDESTEGPPQAGLVTILFTDIESSAALRQRLGDAKAQDLVRTHDSIVRDALKSHQGREIKHTGDGIMSSFSTASSALEAAIAIQRGIAAHVQEHPDAPLGVYIGLNAGEPIAEEKDLFGTSVDLARRICDHAQPGQVLVSDVVRQLAAGKDFLFSDCGETEMRGFEDPVRLYEVRWHD